MALKVRNNSSSTKSLNNLNKNNNELSKRLKKVSSGMRINSAADDASGYAISERMRERLRSLDKDTKNVQTGASLLRVAEGAIANILEELRHLKELALNAANDTNTDLDRATIQKEFDQKKANINDIATTTNYNGKTLLDGTYMRREIVPTSIEPTEEKTLSGNTITEDGVYDLAGFTGTLTISAANVKLTNSAGTTLNDVYIVDNGLEDLWLENIKINNTTDKSAIAFSGTDNKLHLCNGSSNSIVGAASGGAIKAIVNAGDGLTITDNGALNISSDQNYKGAGIGSDSAIGRGRVCGDIKIVNNANVTVKYTYSIASGAAIGSGGGSDSSCGNITIGTGARVRIDNTRGAGIGSGAQGSCGDITIATGAKINTPGSGYEAARIGAGYAGSCGDITIGTGASIIYASSTIGIGVAGIGTCGTITRDAGEIIIKDDENIIPEDNPLVIQYGTKANQAMHVYLNDIHTSSLKTDVMSDDDLLEVERLSGEEAAELQAVLNEAGGKSLDDAKVVTQHDANVSLRIIDGAIQYALEEATRVGAYLMRLEFTESNLVTESENTQSSESTIRDADMAKEMTEYTKANVLAQAAQSMLAQANQNTSGVISLLQ